MKVDVATKGKIHLGIIRGDSDSLKIQLREKNDAGAWINKPLGAGDTVYFTVKKSYLDEKKLIQKVITEFVDGKAIIQFVPNDTKGIAFGTYVYDIQITFADGTVKTIVPPSRFEIMPEVTCE